MKKKTLILLATGILISSALLACGQKSEDSKIDVDLIAGNWDYKVHDSGDTENFILKGDVVVKEDGSYTYTSLDGDMNKGSVRLEYEEYSDGTNLPMFNFYEEGDSFWIGTYYDENDKDTLWIGNGGEECLVRNGQ